MKVREEKTINEWKKEKEVKKKIKKTDYARKRKNEED